MLHPIVIDNKNNLIAGERRLRACQLIGWKRVPVTVVPLTGTDMLRAERDENTERAAFLPSEMVAVAERFDDLERAAAKTRQSLHLRRGNSRSGTIPQRDKGRARDQIGLYFGVSGKHYAQAKFVVDAATDSPDRFKHLLDEMDRTGNVSGAYVKVRRLQLLAQEPAGDLPKGKFRVIYADPPWSYGLNQHHTQGVSHHYRTMALNEMCALPVAEIVAKNAVLFLWVPAPQLEHGLSVINAWGFAYKTGLVWDKVRHMFGNYVSVRHEHLLIATRGSCVPDQLTPQIDSVLELKRGNRHSEKPKQFRAVIERLYPRGRRLELFARTRTKGWTAWGDDAALTRRHR
jgi:N6-adenosine-specific RNA methylase IME4